MNWLPGSVWPRRVPEPAPAAPHRVPQVLGQVLQRRQRREQRGLLTAGQARYRFGDHREALRPDPLVDAAALRRDLDPGRAEVVWIAQPVDQAVFIELADDTGQHRRVDALELGEFGQAERSAHAGDAQHRGLGRGQPFLPGGGVELPREIQDDTPQPDDRVTVHARCSGFRCVPPFAGCGQLVARMTSDALITAVTSEPTDRPSCLTASTVIEATRRVPPASSSTFAMASPVLMLVTRAGIWLRALSGML